MFLQPYLIVDVREREEYDVCHITESICVPVRVLSRDTVPPEIFRYVRRFEYVCGPFSHGCLAVWLRRGTVQTP